MIFVPREVRILIVVLEILCCIPHFIGLILNTSRSLLEIECIGDCICSLLDRDCLEGPGMHWAHYDISEILIGKRREWHTLH
jgi:hypothetical protein